MWQRTQPQTAQVDLVAIVQPGVGELAVAGRRRQYLGSVVARELVCAGKEVGVQMGVGGERDGQTPPGRGLMNGAQVAADVDDQSPSVAQID